MTCVSNAWSMWSPEKSSNADRFTDRREVAFGVGKGDAGAASAEVAEHDHAAGRQAGVGAQRRQRGGGVGNQCQSRRAEPCAARRSTDGRQCAGTATAVSDTGMPSVTDWAIAPSASASSRSG